MLDIVRTGMEYYVSMYIPKDAGCRPSPARIKSVVDSLKLQQLYSE